MYRSVEIRLLGPIEVVREGLSLQLGGPRQQSVLALLVALSNETVSTDRLIDEIWGEQPPAAAKNSLQSMISNLRKALDGGDVSIDRQGSGYVLRVAEADVDALRFAQLIESGRLAIESDPSLAARTLRGALDLWRGRPYAGLADDVPALQADAVRLEELRLQALQYRMEADLALGRHGELVGELEALLDTHPLAEELYRLLMLALYRSGRQAEALRVYTRLRRTLGDELGIEPSSQLQQLEQEMLEQDVSLLAPATPDVRTERPNPYKGLAAFGEGDADDFFGRDALVEELLTRIDDSGPGGFLALVGPSGSGKSSVVRAGVIPRLRAGAIHDSRQWLIASMFPGSRPFEELEGALLRAAPDTPAALLDVLRSGPSGLRRALGLISPEGGPQVLLVIDQFEELFVLAPHETRSQFIGLLVAALGADRSPLRLVVTIRSDFLGEPLLQPQLADLLRAGTILVPPLGGAELEEAVVRPATRVGVEVEPSLVVAALADAEGNPGALPMLQHALAETFAQRKTDTLTRSDYKAVGGVAQAVANTAADVLAGLTEGQRQVARQVFLRLLAPGEGSADTRRRALVNELHEAASTPADVDTVLDAFGTARLLTFDFERTTQAATIEIAHEALLAEWPQLRRWIDEARDDIRTERRLAELAAEWEEHDRSEAYVLREPRLDFFTAWRSAGHMELTTSERTFLETSAATAARDEREARHRRRRVVSALVAATIVSLLLAGFAIVRSVQSARDARLADVGRLAAQAVAAIDVDPELAVLLAVEAVSIDPVPDAQEALHRAVQANRLIGAVPAGGLAATWIDDQRIAALDGEGRVIIHDVLGQSEPRAVASVDANATSPAEASPPLMAASPLGGLLAVGLSDGSVSVLDLQTGTELWSEDLGDGTPSMSWRADGQQLAVRAEASQVARGGIFSARSGALVFEFPECACIADVAFNRSFTAPEIATRTRDTNPLVPRGLPNLTTFGLRDGDWSAVDSFPVPVNAAPMALGPGFYVMPDITSNALLVVDRSTPDASSAFVGHTADVRSLAISPAEDRMMSGGGDGTARIWDPSSVVEKVTLPGHRGTVVHVEFNPDGTKALTVDAEGQARVWVLEGAPPSEIAAVQVSEVYQRAYLLPGTEEVMTDGGLVDAGDDPIDQLRGEPGGQIGLVLLQTAEIIFFFSGPAVVNPLGIGALAVEPSPDLWDGGLVVLVPIGDLLGQGERPEALLPMDPSWRGVEAMAFNTAGDRLAIAHGSGSVSLHVFEADGMRVEKEPLASLPANEQTWGLPARLTFEGDEVVILYPTTLTRFNGETRDFGIDPVIRRWDPASGDTTVINLPMDWTALGAGPDHIAVGDSGGTLRIYRGDTGVLVREQAAHVGGISSIAVHPDGSVMLTAGFDATVQVWDPATGNELYTILSASSALQWLDISADGRELLVVGRDGVLRVLALDIDDLVEIAKSQTTRSLTDAECIRYLGAKDRCG